MTVLRPRETFSIRPAIVCGVTDIVLLNALNVITSTFSTFTSK